MINQIEFHKWLLQNGIKKSVADKFLAARWIGRTFLLEVENNEDWGFHLTLSVSLLIHDVQERRSIIDLAKRMLFFKQLSLLLAYYNNYIVIVIVIVIVCLFVVLLFFIFLSFFIDYD
jgi:hypothetical protein